MKNITRESLLTIDLSASGYAVDSCGSAHLVELGCKKNVGLYITSSGGTTHVGTLYLRACIDPNDTPIALAVPTVSITSGAAIATVLEVPDYCFPYLQFYYDRTSGGTGETLEILVKLKP